MELLVKRNKLRKAARRRRAIKKLMSKIFTVLFMITFSFLMVQAAIWGFEQETEVNRNVVNNHFKSIEEYNQRIFK